MILCRAILGEKDTEINIKLLGLCGKEFNSDSLKEQESRTEKLTPVSTDTLVLVQRGVIQLSFF